MNELSVIKEEIMTLYQTNPNIHMDISISSPRLSLKNAEAKIIGVYPNLFQISENSGGFTRNHTIQYVDILTKNVIISELQQK